MANAAFYRAELAKAAPPANGLWYQPGEDGHRLSTALRAAQAACKHDWQIDHPCALVDTCRICGEGRA